MARIYEIQGAAHTSPLEGENITAEGGIVTAVTDNGFYIQDPEGDGDNSTSDGLFIFINAQPEVSVGDEVNITGDVSEFQPGPEDARNLTQTQIAFPDEIEVLSSGNELPAPATIGEGGRIPPSENIDDDSFSDFNPNEASLDFFESLEAMRVTAQDTVAVSPTNRFGEIFTVTDNGENATGISDRGTLNISQDDFNPEKVQIDFESSLLSDFDFPEVNAGAQLGDVTGVIGYDFGNFQIFPTEEFSASGSDLEPETTTIEAGDQNLTLASYNVLNLDPNDEDGDTDVADGRFTSIAEQVVNNLNTPDIIGLQEIQDNDGSEISDIGAADENLQLLVDEIAAAGGPTYEFIDTPGIIPAFENENGDIVRPTGGEPGGNIRNTFLYNSERVNLVEDSVEPLTDPQNQLDNPDNPFFGSRIPLSATFEFNGEEVTVISNHFSSKGGSSAILGLDQPFEELQNGAQKDLPQDTLDELDPDDRFVNGSYNEREAQAEAVKDYVDNLDGDNIIALGDFNEFEFVDPVQEILGSSLTNLVDTLPENERYSFIFQGNSQQLDHILVSDALAETAEFDIPHLNVELAETPERASDHEPLVASVNLEQDVEPTDMTINLNAIGTFETGIFDEGAAEIVAHDPSTQSLFVINSDATTVDILDVSDPTNPVANPMTENQEVAEEPVPDGSAMGDFIWTLSQDNTLTVRGTFSGLSSQLFQVGPEEDAEGNPQSAIHVHTGAAGQNGPILRNLTVETFGDGTSGVFSGEFNLTEEEVNNLEGLYVNLHTENFNSGEIRGQLVQPSIDATSFGDGANSIDVANNIGAVAIEGEAVDANGQVFLFDTSNGNSTTVEVGVLPDMVTFTPDGNKILVANEGEPNDDYTIDPEGSVSIIDISGGLENLSQDNVSEAGFTRFNDQQETLEEDGVRIFGPEASVAQDLEPEYITTPNNSTAYVSLQENNALAVVDIENAEVSDILPLGFKDHSLEENQLDASDEDGINFQTIPSLGMLQPDSIDSFEVDGQTYIVTANEGDAREYEGDPGLVEEVGLDDLLEEGLLDLNDDNTADTGETQVSEEETVNDLLAEDRLGEIDFTNATGDIDDDGLIEQLHNFGGRSFSVFDESGSLVFDSGDQFEKIIAQQIEDGILPEEAFNNDNDENDPDSRSDDKGPEPEAIAVGEVDGTPFAFIGLERIGGIMAYDLSNPSEPEFVQYVNNRSFVDENGDLITTEAAEDIPNPAAGDLGPEGFDFISAEDSPNGEPLLAVGNEVSGTTTLYNVADVAQEETFSLQLLHAADQEAGLPAIEDAVNFSAVMEGLAEQSENTLRLSSGDIYIPGPFFNASSEIYGEPGIGDILINNALGFQAVTLGNHEFDQGTETIRNLIEANAEITGPGIGEEGYQGTAFPYLSTNLDFSEDENLSDLVVEGGQAPQPNTITSSTVIDVNGEEIGVVGATTPILEDISSPGDVIVEPTSDEIEELAAIIQEEVDSLTAEGINKIILSSHFQQLSIEEEVASLLEDVDIVIGGGSNTLLANEDDPLRGGDEAADSYPIAVENATGETTYVVNTDGNYRYVGQLVADFDAEGNIVNIGEESGAFATDEAGVDRVFGEDVNPEDEADQTVVEVTDAIADLTLEADGNVFGQTEVFLNGEREDVRTQETNLGNLTADANLEIANQLLSEEQEPATISLKNGGGIRDSIGQSSVPAGATTGELELLPPQANPAAGKEEGEISQLDIENALRFNNGLVQLTLDLEELELILEHAVEETEEGATPGRFPQVSGVEFEFDPEQTPIEFEFDGDGNNTGEVATDGERIQEITILDEQGNPQTIFEDGEFVVDASQEVQVVTLNFLADGGDGFPFDVFGENRIDFVEEFGESPNPEELPEGTTNEAEFAPVGSEQDALAEFLAQKFPVDGDVAFSEEDTPPEEDTRIVNLADDGEVPPVDADITGDGVVNLDDVGVFAAAFGTTETSDNFNPDADFTGDGLVNLDDLGALAAQFEATVG